MRHVYVDETKARGYVVAAVTVTDPGATRKLLRELILPGQLRIHMKHEQARRRRAIVSALVDTQIEATVYDAARRYRTDLEARSACLTALVGDLASGRGDARLVVEQDDSLVSYDQQRLIEAVRENGLRGSVRYEHTTAYAEPLLALPDVVAWCWVRSGVWRRQIDPIVRRVRTV